MIVAYIVSFLLLSIFISIITEQIMIRRMNLGEGVKISKGACVLKEGYGLTGTNAPLNTNQHIPKNIYDIGEYSN